jgi:hypothetical protein
LAVAARIKCGSSDHIRESLPVQIDAEALQRGAHVRRGAVSALSFSAMKPAADSIMQALQRISAGRAAAR